MARPFNHIGAGQAPTFAISDFARQIAEISAGQRPPVLKVGNIDVTRDFTDVKDVLKAYERGADGRDIVEFLKLIGKRNWQIKINLH